MARNWPCDKTTSSQGAIFFQPRHFALWVEPLWVLCCCSSVGIGHAMVPGTVLTTKGHKWLACRARKGYFYILPRSVNSSGFKPVAALDLWPMLYICVSNHRRTTHTQLIMAMGTDWEEHSTRVHFGELDDWGDVLHKYTIWRASCSRQSCGKCECLGKL